MLPFTRAAGAAGGEGHVRFGPWGDPPDPLRSRLASARKARAASRLRSVHRQKTDRARTRFSVSTRRSSCENPNVCLWILDLGKAIRMPPRSYNGYKTHLLPSALCEVMNNIRLNMK